MNNAVIAGQLLLYVLIESLCRQWFQHWPAPDPIRFPFIIVQKSSLKFFYRAFITIPVSIPEDDFPITGTV